MDALTLKELQAKCKEQGIKGFSGKKKAELIALLTPVESPLTPVETPLTPVESPLTPKVEEPPKPKGRKKKEVAKPEVAKPVEVKSKKPKKEKIEIVKEAPKPKAKSSKITKPIPKPSKDLGAVPNLPNILGFEDEAKILHQWLSNPPSVACLYGPTGIGKTLFAHEFFKTLQYKVIESPTDELPDILYTPSYIPKQVVLMDDAEKAPKLPNQQLQSHILLIGRDKLSAPIQLKVNKPSMTNLTNWLLKKYPKKTKEQLQVIIEEHEHDLRHIILSIESGFSGAKGKDETLNKDAWHCASKLYKTNLSFDTRTAYAEIETDFVSHLVQDGIPKATENLDDAMKALDQLSTTDVTRHTTGKLAMLVATVSKLNATKIPFTPFPSWYGKYSKREKHKRFLNGKRIDIEGMGVLRERVLDAANDGATPKECYKLLQKYGLTYDDLFEMYDEFLYEGSEVGEFLPEFAKEMKKIQKQNDSQVL
jgi:hypothetical protein